MLHEAYVRQLETVTDVVAFLRLHSGLPGPRGNLELMQAAADVGDETALERWISAGSGEDPTDEFVTGCGVVGLGRLVADGRLDLVPRLRAHASDPRWRVREAVAMALQRVGDADTASLFSIAAAWSTDRPYVQRAAVAGVCEPRLLTSAEAACAAVDLLDGVTSTLPDATDRRSPEFRTLRQALGYCWSVAIACCPDYGREVFERWVVGPDPDIRWMLRKNLKKKRLVKLDPAWVDRLTASLS